MPLPRGLSAGFAIFGFAFAVTSLSYADDIFKAKLYPDKRGTKAEFQPISKFCGTKPIKVALSDGWGGNYWRHIQRVEFEDEASKCKNITDVRYTDGEFKPEKQIADIEGLIAQKYDVIVAFLDTGAAILRPRAKRRRPASRRCRSRPAKASPDWARTTSIASPRARLRSASRPRNGWSRRSTARVTSSCSAVRRAIR